MKIPKKLKIGGHIYKIDSTEELDGISGDTDSVKNVIRLSKTLVPSQREATLIHEIFHAINTTFGSTNDGHRFLDSLSEQLYQVLSDNKMLK